MYFCRIFIYQSSSSSSFPVVLQHNGRATKRLMKRMQASIRATAPAGRYELLNQAKVQSVPSSFGKAPLILPAIEKRG